MLKKILLIIDPQNDFIDDPENPGSLAVPGSLNDLKRLAEHIEHSSYDAVMITMDTHDKYDIGHPSFWVKSNGESPAPFTLISKNDVIDGLYAPIDGHIRPWVDRYMKAVGTSMVWPEHCISGTRGWEVHKLIDDAINKSKIPTRHIIVKGTNPYTESYSAIKPEMLVPGSDETKPRADIVALLNSYDIIDVAGQARSHCVNRTVRDIVEMGSGIASKINIISNAMSDVNGFEEVGKKFMEDMSAAGCNVIQCGSNTIKAVP